MPARDLYHDCVRNALIKDGWTITHDPYFVPLGSVKVYVDLGAEMAVGAERGGERIAVEIKSFLGQSQLTDFERAMGQFVVYDAVVAEKEPGRKLFLAVPINAFEGVFREPIARLTLGRITVPLIVFDAGEERIVRWSA